MKKAKKPKLSKRSRQASKIKVNKKIKSMEDALFFKKKMVEGAKMLSVAGLPKTPR